MNKLKKYSDKEKAFLIDLKEVLEKHKINIEIIYTYGDDMEITIVPEGEPVNYQTAITFGHSLDPQAIEEILK